MTPNEFATKLTGLECPTHIPKELRALAKANRLVIVFGASDDLMEFQGAIDEEIGAYEGATAVIDAEGLMPEFEEIENGDKDAFRDYFRREGRGVAITTLWCAEDGYSWTYKTDIPHATFEIVEDGKPYCRGIVFSLDHLKAEADHG